VGLVLALGLVEVWMQAVGTSAILLPHSIAASILPRPAALLHDRQ
jgi:hypothetical protein